MMMHTFLFKWKPEATEAEKERAAKSIRSFQGRIPGLLESSYSANVSPRSQGFTHGGVMKFKDKAAFEAYFAHPQHDELVGWLMPLLEVAAELDYET
ncbi:MAG: Dabb family protein [Acidobacteriaceae bacterium]